MLSSTSDGRGHLEADDHLNVYLNDAPLHTDRRAPTGPPIAPIAFEAARGTSLWVEVVNTMGDACHWTDVYVVDQTGNSHRVLRGNAASGGCRLGIVALVEFIVP